MANPEITAPHGQQEVVITKIINAPREKVFKTITDPTQIPQWWGPRRFSTKVIKMSVMVGGTWRFLQYDEAGREYGFHGVYHDVRTPERLIYTSEYEGMPGHIALYTDKFEERDGKTIITSTVVFQSIEDRDQFMQWGMDAGTIEMTNRLNELLAKEPIKERMEVPMLQNIESSECLTITRTFDAPRERVWERWTDPNQYMCWWGPKDFTSPYAKFDLHQGGKYLSCMQGPDGKKYWDTGTYEEVNEPSRLVYTDTFADEHGNTVPASYYGMGSDTPVEMSVQVTLEDIGGKTRLTIEHCGMPDGDMIEQSKIGWNQSFDKLAECLR
jgi:uncharacterized protein YndB with AHSA1/START domain